MKQFKKGYHITKKSNLYNIQKNGLQPRIGRRSNSVNECRKLLFFCPTLSSIPVWKERLYENAPFDDFAILAFDLDGIKYAPRYDSAGDFSTEESILPENISLIQIIESGTPQNIVSLENLGDALEDISNNNVNSHYQISENPITELFFEEPILDAGKRTEFIEMLAEYEHKKWSQEYNRISWKSHKNSDGSLVISEEDIEQIQIYNSMSYEQVEDFYKTAIRTAIMESFFIMQDNGIINHLGISDEQLISILEHIEYSRRNRWSQHLLSVCSLIDGKYVIPTEKAKLWKSEMRTPYNELSEELKESDRKEVYNIFLELKKGKLDRPTDTPLQRREAELARLEELLTILKRDEGQSLTHD